MPTLLTTVNADGSDYAYIESERLGRTSSKKQYAYPYDQSTIALTAPGATYPEPQGTAPFHRQPFIAPFAACDGAFDVVYIVVHTDPEEATEEIDALDTVVEYARGIYPAEQDFIAMGDLSADGSCFDGAVIDYASEAGMFLFDTVYGLNQTMTEDVSDHYPVYVVFWMGRDRD